MKVISVLVIDGELDQLDAPPGYSVQWKDLTLIKGHQRTMYPLGRKIDKHTVKMSFDGKDVDVKYVPAGTKIEITYRQTITTDVVETIIGATKKRKSLKVKGNK